MAEHWTLLHTANLSRNRIEEWTQFYDVYDEQGAWVGSDSRTHRDVPPLLTPEVLANLGFEWSRRDAEVALIGRYVADSHLDNTGNDDLIAPSYTRFDLRASTGFGRFWKSGRPRLVVYVDNLLDDEEQYPAGYSYPFILRDASGAERFDGVPYYYPLADRSIHVKLAFDL
jgi:hypothetical protein